MCKCARESFWISVCEGKRGLTKALMVAHFQSCLDVSASLDRVSVRTNPLQSGLSEVPIRQRFCYCPLVRSCSCMHVRSGCLCPLPSGLLPVTHVLPIQVTNALEGVSIHCSHSDLNQQPPARVFTRAQLAANGPIDLDPSSATGAPQCWHVADIFVFQTALFLP